MATQFQTESSAETTSPEWSAFFLRRLDRLTRLSPAPGQDFDADKLLRRVTYTTYMDCRELGVGEKARDLLLRNQQEARLPDSGEN